MGRRAAAGKANERRLRMTPQMRLAATLASLALAAAAGASGCSLLVDAKSAQCDSDRDCAELRPGLRCGDDHVCVTGEAPCATNAECISRKGGAQYLCRRPDRACVPLLSTDCTTVLANPEDICNDDTL